MKSKVLYMETTGIAPERSAAEVSSELIKAGATQINTSYNAGKIVGLRWVMRVNGVEALFEMPARVEPIYRIFAARKGHKTGRDTSGKAVYGDLYEKAERVAWRQLLRWVQAQNAMIETGMVQPMEVFTAYYIRPGDSRTLGQWLLETQFKALTAPESAN